MTTYATPDDVEVRLGRPLTDPAQAVALLRDAEVLIRSRVLDLAARVADEPGFLDVVVMVEANAVVRVLRNPEGLRAVTVTVDDGSVTRTRDQATSDGALRITDDEWDLLAPVYGPGLAPHAGKCRVQATAAQEQTASLAEHTMTLQRYTVHVPVAAFEPAVGDVITIVDAVDDEHLAGRTFRVVALLHKSQATAYRLGVQEVTR